MHSLSTTPFVPPHRPQLFGLLDKLISKLNDAEKDQYHLLKVMKSHILPLTNIDFDKSGSKFVTGSYDRYVMMTSQSVVHLE